LADSLATFIDFSLANNQTEIWLIPKAILITVFKWIHSDILILSLDL
jgi:hypothetical protein